MSDVSTVSATMHVKPTNESTYLIRIDVIIVTIIVYLSMREDSGLDKRSVNRK